MFEDYFGVDYTGEYSEEQFQYDQSASNWAGYDDDGTINTRDDLGWDNSLDTLFSNSNGDGENSNASANIGNTGSFSFSGIEQTVKGILGAVSSLGNSAMAAAAVAGKTSGQFKSLGTIFDSAEASVTGGTGIGAVFVKYLPYILLVGGALITYKVIKED